MQVISYSTLNYRIIEIPDPLMFYVFPPTMTRSTYKLQKRINLFLFKFWYTLDDSTKLKPEWFNYPLMKENKKNA